MKSLVIATLITILSTFLSFSLCKFIILIQGDILFKNNILITSLGLYYAPYIFIVLIGSILMNIVCIIIELRKFYPNITKLVKILPLQFLLLLLITTLTLMHYIRIDGRCIYYNKLISIKEKKIDFNDIQSIEIYAKITQPWGGNSTKHFSPVMNIKTSDTIIDIWYGGGLIGSPETDEIMNFLNTINKNNIIININNNFNNEMKTLLSNRNDCNEIAKIFNINK